MMTIYPKHQRRPVTSLDGMWDFHFLRDDSSPESLDPASLSFDDRMPVPSAFDAYPRYAGLRGTAAYRRLIDVPPGSSARLRFRGLGLWARIVVDGQVLKTVALPYSQFEVDLPPSPRCQRELLILTNNVFSIERVPLQSNFYDFYAYGGIYRSIELHLLPDIHIRSLRLKPGSHQSGEVEALLEMGGIQTGCVPITLAADGVEVFAAELPVADGQILFRFRVPDARPWSAQDPRLHTIVLNTPEDDWRERIGFRQIDCEGGVLRINGTAQKLLGYCRHEAHPHFGPALPLQLIVQDLQILKDMGCNFIRGSHYPQDPDFLALCDEMGFFVFEESLGWGNQESQFSDPQFCEGQIEQTRLMIQKSFNHPCVILWGFLNEGASNLPMAQPLYRQLYNLCKTEDPSRPATYASMFPLEDCCYDCCDVVSINTYPGWYAADKDGEQPLKEIEPRIDAILRHLSEVGQANKPFLVSEIGAGALYGWRDALNAHWTEDFQAEYLGIVCRKVLDDTRITGVSLWQFCDGRTYATARALQRPRAFNNKGSFDEYRRPKMAFRVVRDAFLTSNPLPALP